MELKVGKKKIKRRLPSLLPGSELKRANPNAYRVANLKGLAIAIVVRAEEQKASKVRKRVWFTLWEKERKEAKEYATRRREHNYRRYPHMYTPPDKVPCKPEGWGTRNWLKKSLFGEGVDWYGLHKLIGFAVNQSPDHNCEWWCAVKDICEDITGFDPVAEILKISNEYRVKEHKTVTKKKVGRPKVSEEKAKKRRGIKADWERYRDTVKAANKKKSFCDENGITVEYLEDTVLRWCRYHSE